MLIHWVQKSDSVQRQRFMHILSWCASGVVIAMLCSSCGKPYYTIATNQGPAAKYCKIEAQDSTLLIVPWEYRDELTPEVIHEYGIRVPLASITQLDKMPPQSSAVFSTIGGGVSGMIVGGVIGSAAYTPEHSGYFSMSSLNRAVGIMAGSVLGLAPGLLIGYFLRPGREDLMPSLNKRLIELRNDHK